MPKLAVLLVLLPLLGGCITPQEIYKLQHADAACSSQAASRDGHRLGCLAGSSVGAGFATYARLAPPAAP
jgi:hypothetical protein